MASFLEYHFEFSLLIVTFFTVIIQCYIIYLIKFQTPIGMKEYRFFLYILSIVDMLFAVMMGFVIIPFPLVPLNSLIFNGVGRYFGQQNSNLLIGFAVSCGYGVLFSELYCLCFRVCAVYENKVFYQILMDVRVKVVMVFGWSIASFGPGYCYFRMLMNPKDIPFYLENHPPTKSLMPGEVIVLVKSELSELSEILPFGITMLVVFAFFEALSLGLVATILLMLKKNAANFSENTARLHKQYTRLLGFQLITPLFCIVYPVSGYILATLNGYPSNLFGMKMGFFAVTFYGMPNGILTLFFISPYRKYTFVTFIKPVWNQATKLLRKYSLLSSSTTTSVTYLNNNGQPVPPVNNVV